MDLVEQLHRAQARLQRIVEASGAGTWELDVRDLTLHADGQVRRLLGAPLQGPFSLEDFFTRMEAGARPAVEAAIAAALEGRNGGEFRQEHHVHQRDGSWTWIESRGRVDFDAEGRPISFFGTAVDITARKEAELAQSSILDALAIQPLLLMSVLRGPGYVFEVANEPYRRLLGGRELVGKSLDEAIPELEGQGFKQLLDSVMASGAPFVGHELPSQIDRGDGRLDQGYFDLVYQPIRGQDRFSDRVLALGIEVTAQVKARQDAERMAQREKERSDFEQQLIGIVSHDLRSPLSAVLLTAAAVLRRGDIDEHSVRGMLRIQSSTERATRMVRDLLDFTQARIGGGIHVDRLPTDIHQIARNVLEELESTVPTRTISLKTGGDGHGVWDPDRLAQVIQNLVGNALTYSPPNTPVSVAIDGERDTVSLSVHNRGTPISEALLPNIFEPLRRAVDPTSTRHSRSIGLGLYIVKQIVDAHDGSITLVSNEQEGTKFSVRLPRNSGAKS